MIPMQRSIFYLLLLGLLPLGLVYSYSLYKQQELESLENSLETLYSQAAKKSYEERHNHATRKRFAAADHFYIDNEIEKIPLLQNEIATLQKALNHGYHSHEGQLRQRLTYLTNGQNSISFVESPVKSYKHFKETVETLARPVELDPQDLSLLLSRIEGVQIGPYLPLETRPDLVISEFKVEKKKGSTHEAFSLQMKLIKREYSH